MPGQGKPPHRPRSANEGFDVADFLHYTYHYLWNWREPGRVQDAYAPNLRFTGSTGRAFYGRSAYASWVLSIMAMFPDLAFQIDDLYWMGNEQDGYLTAMRWSIVGTHRGSGIYGSPTGRPVYLWGITQHNIQAGRIVEECTLFNEFEVMQQIYRD